MLPSLEPRASGLGLGASVLPLWCRRSDTPHRERVAAFYAALDAAGNATHDIIDVADGCASAASKSDALARMWPLLRPGGLVVLRVSSSLSGVIERVQSWTEHLTIHATGERIGIGGNEIAYLAWYGSQNNSSFVAARERAARHPLPRGVSYVACEPRVCVVAKACPGDLERSSHPRDGGSRRSRGGTSAVPTAPACLASSAKAVRVAALAQRRPTTDKVLDHTYDIMYGHFLLPLRDEKPPRPRKMLEIGLGCTMAYGPGSSVRLWRGLLPHVELWEAEAHAACVENSRAKGMLDGAPRKHTLYMT